MRSNPFPSITNSDAPATSITGCYHTNWCCADDYPAGTIIRCIEAPKVEYWREILPDLLLKLTDDDGGRAFRCLLMYWEKDHGAQFRVEDNKLHTVIEELFGMVTVVK